MGVYVHVRAVIMCVYVHVQHNTSCVHVILIVYSCIYVNVILLGVYVTCNTVCTCNTDVCIWKFMCLACYQ